MLPERRPHTVPGWHISSYSRFAPACPTPIRKKTRTSLFLWRGTELFLHYNAIAVARQASAEIICRRIPKQGGECYSTAHMISKIQTIAVIFLLSVCKPASRAGAMGYLAETRGADQTKVLCLGKFVAVDQKEGFPVRHGNHTVDKLLPVCRGRRRDLVFVNIRHQ